MNRTSKRMQAAMQMILDQGLTPYRAAHLAGVARSTMYRSPVYKAWRDASSGAEKRANVGRALGRD